MPKTILPVFETRCITSCNYSTRYTTCLKNRQNCFWHNFVKFLPTLIIFGKKMATTILLCLVHSITTSP